MLNASPAAALFSASLDPADGAPNDGSGLVAETSATMAPMTTGPAVLTGRDVNPLETQGIFNTLLRLENALTTNDQNEINRSINSLDANAQQLNFARAELGAREQGLSVMQDRQSSENIELQQSLSDNYDADLAQVISDLSGQQAAFQASLKTTATIAQMTLLNYL